MSQATKTLCMGVCTGILIPAILFIPVFAACEKFEGTKKIIEERQKLTYKFGYDSAKIIPSTANPYVYHEDRESWLKGWIDGQVKQ